MRLNVLDFASPDDAFAVAQDGDTIYFPNRGLPYSPGATPGYWPIATGLTIVGDGAGLAGGTGGSRLLAKDNQSALFKVQAPAGNVYLRDLQLQPHSLGANDGTSGSIGILCQLGS